MSSNKFLLITLTLIISSFLVNAEDLRKQFVQVDIFEDCEGKDVANYTYIRVYSEDQDCSLGSLRVESQPETITAEYPNKKSVVNMLRVLARSAISAGIFIIEETFFQVTSGPDSLGGKYLYKRSVYTEDDYLKRCSSVLGQTAVKAKRDEILISDDLDFNVLVSPIGGYQVFKRHATTLCRGQSYAI